MRKEDIHDIVRRIPPHDQTATVLVMKNGSSLTAESIARMEPQYLVMRGREGGTGDDGRGFFVPYDDICFIKIDRVVKVSELKRMYGETVELDFEERLEAERAGGKPEAKAEAAPAPAVSGGDPASIAKQNLLSRLRAARTTGGAQPPGK